MLLRDLARETATKYLQMDDWALLKKLKSKCNRMVKNDRASHYKSLNDLYIENNDSASLFKLAKQRMNIKNGGNPTVFLKNGKMVTAPSDIANMQMDYYCEKVKKLMENLPMDGIDPLFWLKNAMTRWGSKAKLRPTFGLQKIGAMETLRFIRGLGSSKSMGRDGLDAEALKMAAATLYNPLMFIINLSIESGKFCNRWKLAKLVPLHKGKGKSRLKPESFRPISILPVCSK